MLININQKNFFNFNLFSISYRALKKPVMSIAIRLLNSFIYTNVNNTETIFRSAFEMASLTLYHSNTKHWT